MNEQAAVIDKLSGSKAKHGASSSLSFLPPNMESCPNSDRNSSIRAQHAWLLTERGT